MYQNGVPKQQIWNEYHIKVSHVYDKDVLTLFNFPFELMKIFDWLFSNLFSMSMSYRFAITESFWNHEDFTEQAWTETSHEQIPFPRRKSSRTRGHLPRERPTSKQVFSHLSKNNFQSKHITHNSKSTFCPNHVGGRGWGVDIWHNMLWHIPQFWILYCCRERI